VAQFTLILEKEKLGKNAPIHSLADKLANIAGADADLFKKVSSNYNYNAKEVFNKVVDHTNIRGEDNEFRYLKVPEVVVRYYDGNSKKDLCLIILAICVLEIDFTLSFDIECENKFIKSFADLGLKVVTEADEDFYKRFKLDTRIRYVDKRSIKQEAYDKIYKNYGYFASEPPLCEGRFELLNYLLEQSVSTSYHRYGNLGARGV
jgi:RHH-type proline utilization regulon transcriptional repressor/proline dehydrogenase/delta 1-pyrroline-5-carboxylate dehydrogenase